MNIFYTFIPLIPPLQINRIVYLINDFIYNPSFYFYIFLISTSVGLLGLIVYSINNIVKWESKKLLESLELWLSMWAVVTSSVFFIAFWFYVLVSKELGSTFFHFRVYLKYVSYGGLFTAISLTLPLIWKGETLQTFMNKAFLGSNSLEKSYKRLFIFLWIGFGVILQELISVYFKCGQVVSNVIAISTVQIILFSFYFFIKNNFYYFFGDVEGIKKIDSSQKKTSLLSTGEPRLLYSYQGLYNKALMDCIWGYGLLKKLNRKRVLHFFYRNTGPEGYPTFSEAQSLIEKAWYDGKMSPYYTGHPKEYTSGLWSKMVHPETGVGNYKFWDDLTLINIEHRKKVISQELVHLETKRWHGKGLLATFNNDMLEAKMRGLKVERQVLHNVRNMHDRNLTGFINSNPGMTRERALADFPMNGVRDILAENRHWLKFSKQYQTGAFFIFTGYVAVQAMQAHPVDETKKKE